MSFVLKREMESVLRKSEGSEFQSRGVEQLNALLSTVVRWAEETVR